MLTKDEAIKELTTKGYKVQLKDGVILFLYNTPEEYDQIEHTAKKILDEIGYKASWGIKFQEKRSAFLESEAV